MIRSALRQARYFCALITACGALSANAQVNEDFADLIQEARGQTVYFNAWGGDLSINQYIEWAAQRVREQYGITLRHVKVGDIAEAVTRLRAEHVAGRNDGGSIDLLWINGENFAALKNANLLFGPWTTVVPANAWIDWNNPSTKRDGSLNTDGFELPWGTSALTLFYDTARVATPPDTPQALMQWIEQHPGRFSYPQPPAFVGSAFLKQLLWIVANDADALLEPIDHNFEQVTQPLWQWLDRAHASMWRRGRLFPQSGPAQRELLATGELDWMMSYNPSEASRAIARGDLQASIKPMHFRAGALANSHFLAIPYNSSNTQAARVVANFLATPEAQARKADESYWGDMPVLDRSKLNAAQAAAFDSLQRGSATPDAPTHYFAEPHPSWVEGLEQAWIARYQR